ncbi:hypothetical protein [Leptospira alstonii]|uniref:hypothetical protein n=1 Tax=Leptospira alstonii TaxID=28452 RepID=UPI000774B7DA|nr:hypothetical protein [Leptospira alstonii]
MKISILKLSVICIQMFQIVNCSIGSARDACRNNLKATPGASDCELLSIAAFFPSPDETNANGINALMLSCFQYYEKLKECEQGNKKNIPAIYSKK